MKIAKTLKIVASVIMASGLLLSCKSRKEEKPLPSVLSLSAQVLSLDYEGNGLWGRNADIGVFVTETGTTDICQDNENVKYQTKFSTGILTLTPADEPIYLPEEGKLIDIYAYYPYNADLYHVEEAPYVYRVDLSDQLNPDPEILLLARSERRNSVLHTAMLTLRPVFAKLKISLQIKSETKTPGSEVKLSLNAVPCKAEVDVLSGNYLSFGDAESVELIRSVDSVHAYEAVVLAHHVSEDSKLIITFGPSSGMEDISISLKELVENFEQNRQYDVSVTVSPDGVEAVLVGMTDFYVSDWRTDFEDIEGEI